MKAQGIVDAHIAHVNGTETRGRAHSNKKIEQNVDVRHAERQRKPKKSSTHAHIVYVDGTETRGHALVTKA